MQYHILPNSILLTDEWRGLRSTGEQFVHQVVNHSKYFICTTTGVRTNTIEGNWSALKIRI